MSLSGVGDGVKTTSVRRGRWRHRVRGLVVTGAFTRTTTCATSGTSRMKASSAAPTEVFGTHPSTNTTRPRTVIHSDVPAKSCGLAATRARTPSATSLSYR